MARKYKFEALKHNTVTDTFDATEPDWNGGAGPGHSATWFRGIGTIQQGGTPAREIYHAKCTLKQFRSVCQS